MTGPFPSKADVRAAYTSRFSKLSGVARTLRREIEEQLGADPDVVLVQARQKGIKEFVSKALRPRGWPDVRSVPKTGDPARLRKYAYPLREIQDQVGCRVVVKSPRARTRVAIFLARHYGHLEKGYKVDKDPRTFGYAAHHVICPIPMALRTKRHLDTETFEIQVATLFQFAWSQMEHAVGYKAGRVLTREQRRNLAIAAALAEAADILFGRVRASS